MPKIVSTNEALQIAGRKGVILTPEQRQMIADAETAAENAVRARLAVEREKLTETEKFNRVVLSTYQAGLQAVLKFGDGLIAAFQVIAVAIGMLLALIFLAIVEVQRVWHGVIMFDSDGTFATLAALSLVIASLVIKFNIAYTDHSLKYTPPPSVQFTFEWVRRRLKYMSLRGKGERFVPEAKPPSYDERFALNVLSTAILILATLGSLQLAVADEVTKGTNWRTAISNLVEASPIDGAMSITGAFVFSFAALFVTRTLSGSLAKRANDVRDRFDLIRDTDSEIIREARDVAGAGVVNAFLNQHLKQQNQIVIESPHQHALPAGAGVSGVSETAGNTRKQPKQPSAEMLKALAFYRDHPELFDTPERQLEQAAGVSYSTLRRAKAQLQDTQASPVVDPQIDETTQTPPIQPESDDSSRVSS